MLCVAMEVTRKSNVELYFADIDCEVNKLRNNRSLSQCPIGFSWQNKTRGNNTLVLIAGNIPKLKREKRRSLSMFQQFSYIGGHCALLNNIQVLYKTGDQNDKFQNLNHSLFQNDFKLSLCSHFLGVKRYMNVSVLRKLWL